MKKPWFYRMLLSYLPIFFFLSSFLFFIFFQELGAQSKRDAVKANQVLNQLAMDKVENSLNAIDYALIDFSLNNKVLNRFFQSGNAQDAVLNKEMLKEIDIFKRQNPLVDSIYLVRPRDGIVLTERYMFHEDEFAEEPYIRKVEETTGPVKWTSPHEYREFAQSAPKKVVTLARTHFTPLGGRSLVVANVKAESLRALVETSYSPSVSFVSVTGADGTDILGNGDETGDGQILSERASDYLGWTFRSGLVSDTFAFALQVSKVWIALGMITVALGLLAIVYVTRRNYRPLEHVVTHIRGLVNEKESSGEGGANEFMLIESAIENLMKRSTMTEKRRAEEINLRKKHFLYELVEGIRHVGDEEWTAEMAKYNFPATLAGAQAIVVEIDNEAAFGRDFSRRDQLLLKYAIHNSAAEIFHKIALPSWSDWVSGRRLICLVLFAEEVQTERVRLACGELAAWVKRQLPLTVTVGMGSVVARHDEIASSYREALLAARAKFFRGLGRIIPYEDAHAARQGAELFGYLAPIRSLVHDWRTGSPEWSDAYRRLFAEFRSGLLSADDIAGLVDYLAFQLDRMAGELAPEFGSVWRDCGKPALTEALGTAETLEDIQLRLFNILYEIGETIGSAHAANHHHRLLLEVKRYIEAHFADPDLSLERLRDQFELNPKYISQLFKEKFGEGFMDFLIGLRIEHAKELLVSTTEPVQLIAGKVGYLSVISFTRAFKKVALVSPGDYRKMNRTSARQAREGTCD